MFRHIDISNTAATCHVCGDLSLDFGSTPVPVCCHIDVLCLAVSCKALSQVRCSLCHIILSATTAMPNVSVQIAAAVADTGANDVTVNIQVAVAAAPVVTPDDPPYGPQPPQEPPQEPYGPQPPQEPPQEPDDTASSGPPSLVSASPASTPRAGPHGVPTEADCSIAPADMLTSDGSIISEDTHSEALHAICLLYTSPSPRD